MLRLADQRRPVAWWVMHRLSRRYRIQYEARALSDWQRVAMRRAVLIPDRKLLYVLNAKAASSSLRDMMYRLGTGPNRGERPVLIFVTKRWRELVAALDDPEIYRFSVARHPVARAVSAFANLFVERRNGFEWRHIPYMRRTGLKFGDASAGNFDRFLDYVEEAQAESAMFCDVHLRLQTHNIGARHMRFDRIGHVETLLDDVQAILREAGVGDFRDAMLGRVNPSSEAGAIRPGAAQIARIETIYAEDYQRLGYERDGSWPA